MNFLRRLLQPFRSHTTYIYYDECGEFDQEKFDEVFKQLDKTFEAMDIFFATTPSKAKGEKK